jgi:hypothetical protein
MAMNGKRLIYMIELSRCPRATGVPTRAALPSAALPNRGQSGEAGAPAGTAGRSVSYLCAPQESRLIGRHRRFTRCIRVKRVGGGAQLIFVLTATDAAVESAGAAAKPQRGRTRSRRPGRATRPHLLAGDCRSQSATTTAAAGQGRRQRLAALGPHEGVRRR